MKIVLHRNFKKQYKKLSKPERRRFREHRNTFLQNPFHPTLNNHPLRGEYKGCRSFNVGGDLRVIYEEVNPHTAYFVAIGTHSELYE